MEIQVWKSVGETAELTDDCKESDRVVNAAWERAEKKAKLMGSETQQC